MTAIVKHISVHPAFRYHRRRVFGDIMQVDTDRKETARQKVLRNSQSHHRGLIQYKPTFYDKDPGGKLPPSPFERMTSEDDIDRWWE